MRLIAEKVDALIFGARLRARAVYRVGHAQGKKVDPSAVAAQSIEAKLTPRPDQVMKRPCGGRAE